MPWEEGGGLVPTLSIVTDTGKGVKIYLASRAELIQPISYPELPIMTVPLAY